MDSVNIDPKDVSRVQIDLLIDILSSQMTIIDHLAENMSKAKDTTYEQAHQSFFVRQDEHRQRLLDGIDKRFGKKE